MTTLNQYDVGWIVRRLPESLVEFMKTRPNLIVGGGFIRACVANEEAADIDVFSPSADIAKALADELKAAHPDVYTKVISTENAITLLGGPLPVQFIHRWSFGSAQVLIESFDFTIASAAIWYQGYNWHSACDDEFYADLAAKRLVYRSPKRNEDAGGSILRVLKFYQRGYRIPLDSLGAVLGRLSMAVEWKDVIGDEIRISRAFTSLMVEVDPSLVDGVNRSFEPSRAD